MRKRLKGRARLQAAARPDAEDGPRGKWEFVGVKKERSVFLIDDGQTGRGTSSAPFRWCFLF